MISIQVFFGRELPGLSDGVVVVGDPNLPLLAVRYQEEPRFGVVIVGNRKLLHVSPCCGRILAESPVDGM